jgi:hypothetical protein
MAFRLMLASAATLAFGAAALLAQPEPPAERVATRAEFLAAHPQPAAVMSAACTPAQVRGLAEADI